MRKILSFMCGGRQSTRRVVSTAIGLVAMITSLDAQPLRVEQALSESAARVEKEDTRVPLLEAHVRLLTAMSKRRLDFRPNLGLFSFSSPALLAATLGSGLTYQSSRVAPQTMEAAAHDLLLARIARERAKVRAQVNAARAFFDVLEKQEAEKARCAGAELRQKQRQLVRQSMQAGSLTALDVASFQHLVLDAEWTCAEARTQRKLAGLRLASATGRETVPESIESPETTRLADYRQPLPVEKVFHEAALKFRDDIKWLDHELASLGANAKPSLKASLANVPASLDYRYITQTSGRQTTNYLLGGNTIHFQLPWSIPLTKSTEAESATLLAAARIRALETEASAYRAEVRQEVNILMVELAAAKERIDLAQRKREISLENQELMAARVNGGFAGNGVISTLAMEAAQRESEAGLQMAAGHWRTMLYSLYVACGIHQHPESALDEINKAPEKVSAAGEGQ